MIETALTGDYPQDLKILHKNKQRKDIKKANIYLEKLKDLLHQVHSRSTKRDINAVFGLSSQMFPLLVNIAKQYDEKVSLSHISVALIKLQLNKFI